jgi:cell division protein FtsL
MTMSNLAYKVQQHNQVEEMQQPQKQLKRKVVLRSKITLGEKFLVTVCIGLFAFGSMVIVSNHSSIYEVNRNIQQLEASIEKQTKLNHDLELQVSELSKPERIWQKAKELGLTLDDNNVKIIKY